MSHSGRSGKGNGSRGKGRGGGHGKGRQGTGQARGVSKGFRQGTKSEDAPFPVRTSQSRPRPVNHPSGQLPSPGLERGNERPKQRMDLQDVQPRVATGPAQVGSGNLCKQTPEHKNVTAVIDQENCDGCGTCIDICPMGAITAVELTVIDTQECAGCGMCVEVCPNNAIYLATMKIAQ